MENISEFFKNWKIQSKNSAFKIQDKPVNTFKAKNFENDFYYHNTDVFGKNEIAMGLGTELYYTQTSSSKLKKL